MWMLAMAASDKDETVEFKVDMGGPALTPDSWAQAIRDLEGAPRAKPASPPAARPPAAPVQKAMTLESAMGQVIADVKVAREALAVFTAAHPYLIAPNVFRMWEDNLKETALLMERELGRKGATGGR